jgi:hypothetical protein
MLEEPNARLLLHILGLGGVTVIAIGFGYGLMWLGERVWNWIDGE